MKSNKKYVVLEHLTLPDRGFKFWTTNTENNTHGQNGELWYKEVLFTDSETEAITESQNTNMSAVAGVQELNEYYKNNH